MNARDVSPELADLLAGRSDDLELDEAALELATLEDPTLDRGLALATLDGWAERIAAKLTPAAGGAQYLTAAHGVLFDEIRIMGDSEDYLAPANSCLHHALERRRGLPITLSVMYMEIARRLLRPVFGIPLPAHFVCRYNDGLVDVFVDPFNAGRLMTEGDCLSLVHEVTGQHPADKALTFAPATKRQILLRMASNLRRSYLKAGRTADVSRVDRILRAAVSSRGDAGF